MKRTIRISQLRGVMNFMAKLQISNPYEIEERLQQIVSGREIQSMTGLADFLSMAWITLNNYMNLFNIKIEFHKPPDYWELKAAELHFSSPEALKGHIRYWLINGGRHQFLNKNWNIPWDRIAEIISEKEIKEIRENFTKGRVKHKEIPDLYDSNLDKPAPIRNLNKREIEELGYVTV